MKPMKKIIINAVAGPVALTGLSMLIGDVPEANAVTFASVKICGGALFWIAYKALEKVHPEWEEEEV